MNKNLTLIFVILLFLCSFQVTAETYYKKIASKDSYTNQASANTNYENAELNIQSQNTNRNMRGYIGFNFSVNKTLIKNGTLKVTVGGGSSTNAGLNVRFYYCNDDFTENTITWTNQDTEVINCNATYFASQSFASWTGSYIFPLSKQIINDVDGIFTIKIKLEAESYDATARKAVLFSRETGTVEPYINYTKKQNFTITAKYNHNSTLVSNFNVKISNSTYTQTYSNINSIVTNIPPNTNKSYNLTFYKTGFYNETYLNWNVLTDLRANLSYALIILSFKDKTSSLGINGTTITVKYPSGTEIDYTTNSTGHISFLGIRSGIEEQGTYIFTFSKSGYTNINLTKVLNRTNVPITQTYNISRISIIINVYNRQNGSKLTKPVTLYILGLFNVSTSTGTYTKTNVSIVEGTYTVQALSNDYGTEQQTFTYNSYSNVTIDLYLLNLTNANAGNLFINVLSGVNRISGARVILREYNPIAKTYIEVSECISNSNGECAFYIELNSKTYDWLGSKLINNVIRTGSLDNPEIIVTDNEIRDLYLEYFSDFTPRPEDNLVYTISQTFLGNVSNISTNFYTTNGLPIELCTTYYLMNPKTAVQTNCSNSTSSIQNLNNVYAVNRSNYYTAEVYINTDGTYTVLRTYYYPSIDSISEILPSEIINAIILMSWVVCLGLCLHSKNISLFGFLAILLSWSSYILFPMTLMIEFAVFKTMISVLIVWHSRKIQDND